MRGRLRWYLLLSLAVCAVAGLLFWYGGASAQDGCTVRVLTDGKIIIAGCEVVTATPPAPPETDTPQPTPTSVATIAPTATLIPVTILPTWTATAIPTATPQAAGPVLNVPLLPVAAGSVELDANNRSVVSAGSISPDGGYTQVRLIGADDGLRVYAQVMTPAGGGSFGLRIGANSYVVAYPSTSAWSFGLRGDRGWTATRLIPWSEFGGKPEIGDTWPLSLIAMDDDTWQGTLHWGLPDYAGQNATGAQVLTTALNADAVVGGSTDCGAPAYPDYFPGWGNLNWGDSPYAIAQNQWDAADWPCYAKYYAQWPLSGIPPGAQVVSATVELRHFGNPGYGAGYADDGTGDTVFQVSEIVEPWGEATITWDSAPIARENTSRTKVLPIDITCGGLRYCNPGIPYLFDVTEIVRRSLAEGRAFGSMELYTAAGQYHSGKQFSSREGSEPPIVRIAYILEGEPVWTATPTPTPSASATAQPSATPAPTGTALPVATASPTPSATPVAPTSTPILTATASPTPTPNAPPTSVSPTPQANPIDGLAIMGDSFLDEYRGTDNRGGAYASVTRNSIELLQRLRGFNLGPWGTRSEPRRTGYEYVWARSGATTDSMISRGQHTGAAAQVRAGDVSFVFLNIGINDFSPYHGSTYADIYSGSMTAAQVASKVAGAVKDVTTAVDTVLAAGPRGMAVTLFTDPNLDPAIPGRFPNAVGRARVTAAVEQVNAGIRGMAASRGVVVVDQNAFGKQLLPQLDSQGNLTVGGQKIAFLKNGDEPHNARLADGQHLGTVVSGLVANAYFIDMLNREFGAGIAPLTDAEILAEAGLAGSGVTATPTRTPTRTPTQAPATSTPGATAVPPTVTPAQPGSTPVAAGCTVTVGPSGNLSAAVAALKPGDVLCLQDGRYMQSIEPRTNGTQANPITIKALNDGKVTIDGQNVRRPIQLGSNNQAWGDWFVIEGLVLRNSSGTALHVRADNNVFRRISMYGANTDTNNGPLLLWGSNNLVEDCLVGGVGRFMVDVYGGGGASVSGNTIRRCVVKWDGWDGRNFCGVTWPNSFMMGAYNSSGGTFENNLVYGRGVMGIIVQANTSTASANNNAVLGNVVLGMGKERTPAGWEIWDYRYSGGTYPNRPGPTDDPYDDTNCDNSVTPWTWLGQRVGLKFFGQGTLSGNIWRDNLSAHNAGVGFHYSNPGGGRYSNNVIDHITLYSNGSQANPGEGGRGAQAVFPPGVPCTNCRIGDTTTGDGSGARLQYRYVDRQLTNQPLLPWPMEARAQAEMGVSVTAIMQEYAGD